MSSSTRAESPPPPCSCCKDTRFHVWHADGRCPYCSKWCVPAGKHSIEGYMVGGHEWMRQRHRAEVARG